MAFRSVYLAKYGGGPRERAHFALFVPNASFDRVDLQQTFRTTSSVGTIIHVVGEPVMNGFALEIKRNYECVDDRNLRRLILLGYVSPTLLYDPVQEESVKERIPRAALEREATRVVPPPGGQDVRAPIDSVNTKRCQEWTMEFLQRLVTQNMISKEAIAIVQAERDPPTHGIFGQGRGVQQGDYIGRSAQAAQVVQTQQPIQAEQSAQVDQATQTRQWQWDTTYKRYRYYDGQKWQWQSVSEQ